MTHRLSQLREWHPLLPLVLLLAMTYWLNQQVQPLPQKQAASARPHDPDFVIQKFSAMTFNELGSPRFVLAADKVAHYPANDSTVLDEPRLTSLLPNRAPVYTSARQGEVSSSGEEVFLRGDVKAVRFATATQNELSITTDYLHVVPERDLADTDRPVTITEGRSHVQAVGMQLDNKARMYKLLSQVRGQYEPAR